MKKFIKNNLKVIIAVVITAVIFTVIGVYAAEELVIASSDVRYKNKTVESSLNELYIKATSKDVNSLKFCEFIDDTYGSFGEIGSKYECDLGDGTTRFFYLLAINNNNTVDLIMDRNITQGTGTTSMSWANAMKYFSDGDGRTYLSNWTNVIKIDLPTIQAIANAVNNSSWNVATNTDWWNLETKEKSIMKELNHYVWLYDFLKDCSTNTSCQNSLSQSESDAYWTRDMVYGLSTSTWEINNDGNCGRGGNTETFGIRPVITVLKTNLYSE